MILSASRRTDIPAFFSRWFLRRLEEGFLYVRNPLNPRQVSELILTPAAVDCIVFWTKNPSPMLALLDRLGDYPHYFQFTLTSYGRDLEPGLPDKKEVLIPAFRELSRRVGSGRVVWRYDPILLSERYTGDYHRRAFREMAERLRGATRRVVVSFVDLYAKTARNTAGLGIRAPGEEEMLSIAGDLARAAGENGMSIQSCGEKLNLSPVGIPHGSCIDKALIEGLLGCRLRGGKDKGQRRECGCMESVDVGLYHTCAHGCRYCYANHSDGAVRRSLLRYDPDSPLLCGSLEPGDAVIRRRMESLGTGQYSLFGP